MDDSDYVGSVDLNTRSITWPKPKLILGEGPYWHLPHINGYVGVPPGRRPNLWHRFWHWFLLGWVWCDKSMKELTEND